jgi:stage V sporulation protein B
MGVLTFFAHRLLDWVIGGRIATIIALMIAVMIYAVMILKLDTFTEEELYAMPKGGLIVRTGKKLKLIK